MRIFVIIWNFHTRSLDVKINFHIFYKNKLWRLTRQQEKGEDHLLFHSTASTRSWTFRHWFAIFHVRWLSHIFNRIAGVYQTATRWDLSTCWITIWLIGDVTLYFCLFTRWFDSSSFFYSNWRRHNGGFELASTITLVSQATD